MSENSPKKSNRSESELIQLEGSLAQRDLDLEIKLPASKSAFQEIKAARIINQKKAEMEESLNSIDFSDLEDKSWDYDIDGKYLDYIEQEPSLDPIELISEDLQQINSTNFLDLAQRYKSLYNPILNNIVPFARKPKDS